MSPVRVGINGFGRMGRLALRALYEYWRNDITIVHINDPKASAATAAHLLTFDSIHGRWPVPVTVNGGTIVIGSNDAQWTISTSGETNPKLVKWRDAGVDIVIESSGKFVTPESLSVYFGHEQSPRKVIVSAPVKGALNIVMGVNDGEYDEKKCPDIVTAASCTTNCLAPVIAVLLKRVGIVHGSITTIHNVTNTQTVVDAPHADLRRARSCLTSLVPTTTGSATAISLIFPELKGKLNGLAVRVPLLNASITDCAIEVKRPVTVEEVNQWMEEASATGPLKDILGVERLPLVSADFNNDRRSAIVDATNTLVVNGTHVKLIVWYDNEVGYANRLSELTVLVAHRLSESGKSCCISGCGQSVPSSSTTLLSSSSSSSSCATAGSLSNPSTVHAAVRDAYGSVARGENKECIGGSGISCCGTSPSVDLSAYAKQLGYSSEDVSDALAAAGNLGLGCGNPVALASLQQGETVLDLGSGAGFDCFLAANRVGPSGRVIGVDMTADMIHRARATAEKKEIKNVTFIQSTIESLPVEDASVDVVISNCVINLSPEKQKVLNEAFRVLRPGGRFMVTDIVATRELTSAIRNDLSLYTGCMAGATAVDRLESMLREAGFATIKIDVKEDSKSYIGKWAPGSGAEDYVASATISAYKK